MKPLNSAKIILEQQHRTNPAKLMKVKKWISDLEARGIKYNKMYSELSYHQVAAILITPKHKLKQLPMRALINPNNNKLLNDKLSKVWWEETIGSYEKNIRYSNLEIDGITFTSSDIKKIRFSIMWLNFLIHMRSSLKLTEPCLSKDAQSIFRKEGFEGLYKIAKKDKRKLKSIFKNSDEIINLDFFMLSSLGFASTWHHLFTIKDRKKLMLSFKHIRIEEHAPSSFSNLPMYYLYNNDLHLDIKKIDRLYQNGYTKIKYLKILNEANKKLMSDPEICQILFNNFGNYKS